MITALINLTAAMLAAGTLRLERDGLLLTWMGYIACFAVASIGFALRGQAPAILVIPGANSFSMLAVALLWAALRRLRGIAVPAWLPLLAPALWLAACATPGFLDSLPARVLLQVGMAVPLQLGAAREAWLAHRRLKLRSLRDLYLLLGCWGTLKAWRGVAILLDPGSLGAADNVTVSAVLGTAVSFIGLNLARERAARREAAAQQAGRAEIERLLDGLPAVIFLRRVEPDGATRDLYRGGDVEVVTGWPDAAFRDPEGRRLWGDLDTAGYRAFMVKVLRDGSGMIEYRLPQPTGDSRWIRRHCRVLSRSPEGGAELVGYMLDITDLRAADGRAVAAGRLASLGEMATGLAHELKQPLAIIALAAENAAAALARGNVAGVSGRLERIGIQAHRAAAVIETLRRFARGSETGAPARAVGLDSAVSVALSLCGGALQEAQVAVEVALGEAPPTVLGDPVAIQQVLLNLLTNAGDALAGTAPDAVRRVRVAAVAEPETGAGMRMVRLTVADTAGGIPAALLGRLFEPFVTTKGPDRGTGLGLSICHGLVGAMGGSIAVANDAEGAVFTVLLPAAPAGAAAPATAA